MTRKDYVAIAGIIREWREVAENDYARVTADCIARSFAMSFAYDNPRFDRERFLKACGVQS